MFDKILELREEHINALQSVPEANRVYKPGVYLVPEYIIYFVLSVSQYFEDFRFPDHLKFRLWWPAHGGDTSFRAQISQQFHDGNTALDAIMRTSPGCNLQQHCLSLDPKDPQVRVSTNPPTHHPAVLRTTNIPSHP